MASGVGEPDEKRSKDETGDNTTDTPNPELEALVTVVRSSLLDLKSVIKDCISSTWRESEELEEGEEIVLIPEMHFHIQLYGPREFTITAVCRGRPINAEIITVVLSEDSDGEDDAKDPPLAHQDGGDEISPVHAYLVVRTACESFLTDVWSIPDGLERATIGVEGDTVRLDLITREWINVEPQDAPPPSSPPTPAAEADQGPDSSS